MRYAVFNELSRLVNATTSRIETVIAEKLAPHGWPDPDDLALEHEYDHEKDVEKVIVRTMWYLLDSQTVMLMHDSSMPEAFLFELEQGDAEMQVETVPPEELDELGKRWFRRFFPKAWPEGEAHG